MHHFLKPALLATTIAAAATSPNSAFQQALGGQETTSRWTRVPGNSAPAGRHESATAVVNGKLYLMGGRSLRPLDILDIEGRRWRNGSAPPLEVHHTQAAVFDSKIYIVGGLTGLQPETPLSQILIYDPATDRWSTGPNLPAGRARGAAALVVHDDLFYLVGGNTLGHRAGSVAWLDSFNPRTGAWTQLPDAPRVRDHFQAAVLDGKIYAPAGRVPGSGAVPMMDVYDIVTKQWSTAKDPIPTTRSGVGVVAVNGLIVVIGGETPGHQTAHNEVEAYDVRRGAWVTLAPLPIGRHGTQPGPLGDAIHVVAGSAAPGWGFEVNDHWMLRVNAMAE